MSIIEQAARRLEELRRSGIEVPFRHGGPDGAANVPGRVPRRVDEIRPPATREAQAAVHAISRPERAPSHHQSKQVEIDLSRLVSMGCVTPQQPRAMVADEFRVIKRPLLMNLNGKSAAPVERANLIMVTSSLPGEGKTFVAINLAMSMAMEMDKTVLLVDADVSRPAVLSRLGLPPARGLLDMLDDPTVAVSDVLLRTNIDKLSILPAGAPRGRATELLASEGMNALLEDLASRYPDRVLIFDAPPLLPSTESRVLATHMGQVILVVEAAHTPVKTVTQALATIESCPVVMPLLNKTRGSEVGFYYGYYGPVQE